MIYGLWVGTVLLFFILFLISPSSFTPDAVAAFLKQYESQVLAVYIFICLCRGFFLIPSTPFVFAGILLFPEMPWMVLSITLLGVIIGSTAVYYFSDLLGFSKLLEKKYPEKIKIWHKRLNSPWATWIVIGWSFFPLVPTDIICYVAGIVKMPYKYLILGVFLGEFVLIYLYVFFGMDLLAFIFA